MNFWSRRCFPRSTSIFWGLRRTPRAFPCGSSARQPRTRGAYRAHEQALEITVPPSTRARGSRLGPGAGNGKTQLRRKIRRSGAAAGGRSDARGSVRWALSRNLIERRDAPHPRRARDHARQGRDSEGLLHKKCITALPKGGIDRGTERTKHLLPLRARDGCLPYWRLYRTPQTPASTQPSRTSISAPPAQHPPSSSRHS